nr:MAG TPA: hypothetical protein [Caudoviricetes sp.]
MLFRRNSMLNFINRCKVKKNLAQNNEKCAKS